MHTWPHKDPNEELDYQFDWSDRLEAGETIDTSTFILAAGTVVLATPGVSGGLTTIWISGGVEGEINTITNRIVTSEGRTYDESAKLRVRSK